MDRLLYILGKLLVGFIQALPVSAVVRLGRGGGWLAHYLDARHRRVARRNVARCFPDKPAREVRALVKENFCRIGEAYTCGIRTAVMSAEEVGRHTAFRIPLQLMDPPADQPLRSIVVAVGHFGNFELYAHFGQLLPHYQTASTYRGLPQPSLNRLLQELRGKSGCLFFERRFEAAKLRRAMSQPGMMLGLLSDQDGGDRGVQLPFLGHNCSTSTAPAVYALRYDCLLHCAICYRTAPGQWRIECGERIPTHVNGKPRRAADIMRDVNQALEEGVRRDPANWFWVHNRWKRGIPDAPSTKSSPAQP
jgi:KDO2-lipid IV(A) lauroyltransferase